MRCYLDLIGTTEIIPDETGIEVSDLHEARAEILRMLAEVLEADPALAAEWRGWTLRVVDSSRQLLFSVSLSDLGEIVATSQHPAAMD
jgi:hypothetical protein